MTPQTMYCRCTGLAFPLEKIIIKITTNFMIAAFFQPLALFFQPAGPLKKVVASLNKISFLLNPFFNADRYQEIYTFLITT